MVNSLVLFWSLLSNSRNSPYLQQFYQPVLKEKITVVTACWILIYLRRHACKVLSKRLLVHNTSTVCGGRQGMIDVCSFPTKGEIKPPWAVRTVTLTTVACLPPLFQEDVVTYCHTYADLCTLSRAILRGCTVLTVCLSQGMGKESLVKRFCHSINCQHAARPL